MQEPGIFVFSSRQSRTWISISFPPFLDLSDLAVVKQVFIQETDTFYGFWLPIFNPSPISIFFKIIDIFLFQDGEAHTEV